MHTRQQNVSDDLLTITRRNKRSKTSINRRKESDPIPTDLIIVILSRLPAKSIARCRCVSKLWDSTLGLPYLTELFLTRSSSRPQLLFACQKDGELFFFSTPQPQNPDEDLSVVANQLTRFPDNRLKDLYSPINGLVCLLDERIVHVIRNPSTGQSLILPKVKTRKRNGVKSYFGYDPFEKQYKVLSMTWPDSSRYNGICEDHQVLKLGTGKLSWRKIECCTPHFPGYSGLYNEICINGVLYYLASVNWVSRISMIVCFDVRSEKFSFMKLAGIFNCEMPLATLVYYNGKLGAVMSDDSYYVSGTSTSFQLWVLEDVEKHKWSKHKCVLPPLWKDVVGSLHIRFVGMTRTNEIVLSPINQTVPSYLFYYNIERKTIIRVRILGMEAFKGSRLHTFLNHVENVKLIREIRLGFITRRLL